MYCIDYHTLVISKYSGNLCRGNFYRDIASRTDEFSKCKKHTVVVDNKPRFNACMHTLVSSLAEWVQNTV